MSALGAEARGLLRVPGALGAGRRARVWGKRLAGV